MGCGGTLIGYGATLVGGGAAGGGIMDSDPQPRQYTSGPAAGVAHRGHTGGGPAATVRSLPHQRHLSAAS
jgi:hypothetical protein